MKTGVFYSITNLVDYAGQQTQRGLALAWRRPYDEIRSGFCQGGFFFNRFFSIPSSPFSVLPPSVLDVAILLNLHTVTHGSLLTGAECLVFVILGAELGGQRRAHIPGASWVSHRKLVRVNNQKEMARRLPHLGARRPAVALSAHGAHGVLPGMVFIPVIQPLSQSAWATAHTRGFPLLLLRTNAQKLSSRREEFEDHPVELGEDILCCCIDAFRCRRQCRTQLLIRVVGVEGDCLKRVLPPSALARLFF